MSDLDRYRLTKTLNTTTRGEVCVALQWIGNGEPRPVGYRVVAWSLEDLRVLREQEFPVADPPGADARQEADHTQQAWIDELAPVRRRASFEAAW